MTLVRSAETLKDPRQLDCNHTFCKYVAGCLARIRSLFAPVDFTTVRRECILEHLAGAGQSQCPTCRVPAINKDMARHYKFCHILELWQPWGGHERKHATDHVAVDTCVALAQPPSPTTLHPGQTTTKYRSASCSIPTGHRSGAGEVRRLLPGMKLLEPVDNGNSSPSAAGKCSRSMTHLVGLDLRRPCANDAYGPTNDVNGAIVYANRIADAKPDQDDAGSVNFASIPQASDHVAAASNSIEPKEQHTVEEHTVEENLVPEEPRAKRARCSPSVDNVLVPLPKANTRELVVPGKKSSPRDKEVVMQSSVCTTARFVRDEERDEHVEATQRSTAGMSPRIGERLLVQETPEFENAGHSAAVGSEPDTQQQDEALIVLPHCKSTGPTPSRIAIASAEGVAGSIARTPFVADSERAVANAAVTGHLEDYEPRHDAIESQPRGASSALLVVPKSPAVSTVRRPDARQRDQCGQHNSPVRRFSLHSLGTERVSAKPPTTSEDTIAGSSLEPQQPSTVVNLFQWGNGNAIKVSSDSLKFGLGFGFLESSNSTLEHEKTTAFENRGKPRRAGFAAPRPLGNGTIAPLICAHSTAKTFKAGDGVLAPETQSSQGSDSYRVERGSTYANNRAPADCSAAAGELDTGSRLPLLPSSQRNGSLIQSREGAPIVERHIGVKVAGESKPDDSTTRSKADLKSLHSEKVREHHAVDSNLCVFDVQLCAPGSYNALRHRR